MIPDTFPRESNLASFSRIFGAMTRYPKRLPSPPQGLPEILVVLWRECGAPYRRGEWQMFSVFRRPSSPAHTRRTIRSKRIQERKSHFCAFRLPLSGMDAAPWF